VLRAVFACNQYIDAQGPGRSARTTRADENRLATLLIAIRDLAIAISPSFRIRRTAFWIRWEFAAGARGYASIGDRESYARWQGRTFVLLLQARSSHGSNCPRKADVCR
jgi:methionyl-tRNA synthetase